MTKKEESERNRKKCPEGQQRGFVPEYHGSTLGTNLLSAIHLIARIVARSKSSN
jgi:hypothetical protein